MNIEPDIFDYLETTSLEPHDDYTSEISYKDQKIIWNRLKTQQKEIERLNNIINEYENMKKELLDYIYHNEYCRFGHIDGSDADEMRNILNRTNKLKELWESDNNENKI